MAPCCRFIYSNIIQTLQPHWCAETVITTHNTPSNCSHFQNLDLYHLAYELHSEQLKQYYLPPVCKPLDTLFVRNFKFYKIWGGSFYVPCNILNILGWHFQDCCLCNCCKRQEVCLGAPSTLLLPVSLRLLHFQWKPCWIIHVSRTHTG